MNTLKNVGKRVVALVLALMMCVGMLSTTVFAEDVPEVNEPEQEEVVEVQSKAAAKAICAHWDAWNVKSTWETVSTTPKTCSEYAIEHQVCSKCGDTRDVSDISGGKADHTWSTGNDIKVTTKPTCVAIGTGHHYCKSCGASKLDVVRIPELGHNWVITKDAVDLGNIGSYDTDVSHTVKCTNCKILLTASHAYAPATCTSNAIGKQDCTVAGCNASRDNVEVEGTMLGHSFTDKWIQKGTGHVLQCDRCEYTSATSYGAHTMGDWKDTVEATCTSEGKETRACTKCDHTESRPTPKAQHVYENGSCVNCGQPDPNSPCEHQWVRYDGEEVYKAPTCTDNGVEYIEKCSLCGAQKTYANTALGHDFQDVDGTNTATCTEAGQKEQKCSRCEATQIVEVEALGHSYSALIPETPATCTTTGTQAHYVCTRGNCGALLVGTHEVTAEAVVIPATGHTPGEAVEENRVPARVGVAGSYDTVVYCDVCGNELSRENHTIPALPDTGTGGGDVVIDDTNPPLGGDPDGGDGEVELDDGEIPLAGPVTRAEFVDYLYRHEGSPDTALSTFVDVPADHDYANAVGWGQANNIAWGISETEFAPDELVTVEQVKLFLSRYAAFKGSEMPELAALVGLDDQDPAMNCDEILGEFFGADE